MRKAPEFAAANRRVAEQPAGIAGAVAPLEGFRAIRFNLDWITRPVFGIALAAIAVGSIAAGTRYFAGVVCVLALAAAREWHRMVGHPVFAREVFIAAGSIALAIAAFAIAPGTITAWLLLAAGTVLAFLSAWLRGARAFWQAGGVLYIGAPSLALVALRASGPHGAWLIVGFMMAVWATDTGALIAGNLIGGARLAPVLSPNKTWSGTLGGVVAAAIVEAIYVGVLHGNPWFGAIYGGCVAVVGHVGDLFESWVKRRFQFKDSGGLIPGHGGVLDRVDSTLSAAILVAIAVFAFALDPLFGAHL